MAVNHTFTQQTAESVGGHILRRGPWAKFGALSRPTTGGESLTGFHHEISSRIAATQENLRAALATDDHFLAEVHVGELESLVRLAAENGLAVEGVTETLAGYGVATPSVGLPVSGVIDLRSHEV